MGPWGHKMTLCDARQGHKRLPIPATRTRGAGVAEGWVDGLRAGHCTARTRTRDGGGRKGLRRERAGRSGERSEGLAGCHGAARGVRAERETAKGVR